MRLDRDKIVIESRQEIDILQDMMQQYMEKNELSESEKRNTSRIVSQLDALYMSHGNSKAALRGCFFFSQKKTAIRR